MTPIDRILSSAKVAVSPFPTTLSIDLLVMLKNMLPEDQRKGAYVVIDKLGHSRLVCDAEVSQFYAPNPRITDLEAGYVGGIIGMEVYSDVYRPNIEVLTDHVFVMSADGLNGHGAYLVNKS